MTKLKLMGKNHSDELYTPEIALKELLPFIPKGKILECAEGTGKLKNNLINKGFDVVGVKDFFGKLPEFDLIISNPPYSIKDKFLEKAFEINKPFAFLMPITALEGIRRQKMYSKYGIQIIFPKKRIDFNGKGRPWFYTAWFCYKFNLKKDLYFP